MTVDTNTQQSPNRYIERKKHKPLWSKVLDGTINTVSFLILTWLLSVAIEFVGMTLIWDDEGSAHSQRMLRQEISYLNGDFNSSIAGSSPAVVAFDAALIAKYYLFEWTHLIEFYEWLKVVPANASKLRIAIARTAWSITEYFQALINTTLIYVVRVAVATLSMPAFLLIGIAALIDGLVQRELRIYGGGIERGSIYHHAKPWIKPAIVSTWFLYLSIPVSIHPNLIFVPAMLLFGGAVFLTAALYKKHA